MESTTGGRVLVRSIAEE